jgi:DNA-binding NarL/FixJ family response regulator
MNKIRILVADDHTLIRECLTSILQKSAELQVIAEADNGAAAVRMTRELQPDLVIMDIGMKELNGIEATRRIVREMPAVKVLMLSMHADPKYVIEALNAGASGFVLKSCLSREFVAAIRAVAMNEFYLSHELHPILGREFQKRPAKPLAAAMLTQREREILVMLANGKSYSQIADLLQISSKTVETHRAHIMKKLNVHNIAGLTKYAIREGLLLLD